jgi:hypothetical protein
MMKYLRGFGRFWYGFLIGDDWTIAAAVVAGLLVTYWLRQSDIPAWWLMPAVVVVTLGASVWRGARAPAAPRRS